MDLVVWIEMNKIIFSVVILVSVLGSTAFVAPVLAEEKKNRLQEQTIATTTEETGVVLNEEEVVKNALKEIDGNTYYFDNEEYKIVCIT